MPLLRAANAMNRFLRSTFIVAFILLCGIASAAPADVHEYGLPTT